MCWLKKIVALFLIAVSLSSCSFHKDRAVNRSFYYWKSQFSLTEREITTLRTLKINRIYVKFFDVIWENEPVPAAKVWFVTAQPEFVSIIPTVFITNETMEKLPSGQVPVLADKIVRQINRMIETNHLHRIPEIQIDSDWTLKTRDKYFSLLRIIHARLSKQRMVLSATIRLHQVKYRSLTGVPPVDRGMLMFYNLAPVNRFNTKNSIIDLNIGKTYTATLNTYPLPLDAALPIFSWGVVFQDDHFIGLVNNFRRRELEKNPDFEEVGEQGAAQNYYRVKRDVFLHHTQLYRDDLVRVEEGDSRILQECAVYLGNKISGKAPLAVALFHFDIENLRGFDNAQITSVFDRFR